MPTHDSDSATGWLIADKGQFFLMTDAGWLELKKVSRPRLKDFGVVPESAVAVHGRRLSATEFEVHRMRGTGSARPPEPPSRRPHFAVHPVDSLLTGSRLRGEVHNWARGQGFPEIVLPSVWRRSEEYGVEELRLAHGKLRGDKELILLQSPEFPLWTALAHGVGKLFTFGRCFRYEEYPRPGFEGDYLIEFEQLVLARSFTTVDAMIALAEDLIRHLLESLGQNLEGVDFYRLLPAGLAADGEHGRPGPRTGLAPGIDDLLLFTVPGNWNTRALGLLLGQLSTAGARVHRMDPARGLACADDWESGPAGGSRWAIEPGEQRPRVERILDIAGGMSDAGQRAARSRWNPTWNMYPPLRWGPGEGVENRHLTRSITSSRIKDSAGTEYITDAELYVAGREVAHIREYADADQFRENLKLAGVGHMEGNYDYLLRALESAPSGLVGVYFGWERLLSVLTGQETAAQGQLFPRYGDGERSGPVAPA
ncbi:amino acid--tRNA ligase-related protein [Streptomyces sp. CL12]|uniref:amino acid--tRNA ligase-related protein n=1 Tax=Streptomyces sp. CL12 TaxID=3391744 RepID=UPI003A80C6C5